MTRDHAAEWESHREELRHVWLDLDWTAKEVQKYMSQNHGFCKEEAEFRRQFSKWGYRKNGTQEGWQYVDFRQKKRKQEGKDPGDVYMNQKYVDPRKVRKMTARNVPLSSQYTMMGASDPKTPDGVLVCSPGAQPYSYIDAGPEIQTTALSNDGLQPSGLDPSTSLHNAPSMPPIDFSLLDSIFYNSMQPAANLVDHNGNAIGTDSPVNHPGTADWNTMIQSPRETEDESVAEETRLVLSKEFKHSVEWGFDLDLEPITTENMRFQYTGKAKTSFQGPARERLFGYLNYCIYLSSNDHLDEILTENLVLLIARSRAFSLLKRLLKSNDIAVEIFMANLLGSAAKLGEAEICDVLIQAGSDIDCLTGKFLRSTALYQALSHGKISCAKLLLTAGADPNLPVEKLFPIQYACRLWHKTSLEGVTLLRSFGAAINAQSKSSQLSPLQWAIGNEESELAEYLLGEGADPNFFSHPKSGTPLQLASVFFKTSSMTELLLKAGAKINAYSGHQRQYSRVNGAEDSEVHSDSDSGSDSDSDMEFDFGGRQSMFSDEMCLAEASSFPFMSPILIAAINGHWETVQFLLYEGANINPSWRSCKRDILEREMSSSEISVFTPLQAAVHAKNVSMTRMLLASGAHIDARARGNQGHTALQIAAMVGSERLVRLLLARGADINAPAGICYGKTALQGAAKLLDTTVLRLLLKAGADVNAAPSERGGKTALYFAVLAGNIEGVELLLDSQAALNLDPNRIDDGTILADAIRLDDAAIKKEMIHILSRAGGHVGLPKGKSHHAPLHVSVKCGDLEMTRKLLEKGVSPNLGYCAESNMTPLQRASARGDQKLVDLLIEYGADINAHPGASNGRTALQAAARMGHSSIINLLLKHGADIKSPSASPHGISVIEAAVQSCNIELVKMLLERCPDAITSRPEIKYRVLGQGLSRRNMPLIELLLKAGASTGDDKWGTNEVPVIQQAVCHEFKVFKCILAACGNPSQRWVTTSPGNVTALQAAASDNDIDIVRSLLERDADVNASGNKYGGGTALQTAVSRGNLEMVELLIRHGADVNGLPSPVRGRTALQIAAQHGFVKLTEYLIARGAHVNAAAAHQRGVTALQAAAIGGNIRIVQILLRHGAHVNGAPAIEEGRTAIEGAAEHGRLHTLQLLLEKHPNTEDFDIKRKRAARFAQANGRVAIERFLLAFRKQPRV